LATTPVYGVERVTGVGQQPDGKLLVALDAPLLGFAVARYTAAGAVDRPFGLDGVASALVNEGEETLSATVRDAAGGFVSAGWAWPPLAREFGEPARALVVRHTAAGRIDRAFGEDGAAAHPGLNRVTALARAGGGALVVAGVTAPEQFPEHFAVGRLTAAGTPDTSFASTGPSEAAFRLPVPSVATAVTVRADGRIVAAGIRDDGTAIVVRLLPGGAPDTSFSGDGIAVFAGLRDVSAVRSLSDGRIVVAGSTDGNLAAMRLTAVGTPDRTFDADGFATVDAGGTDVATALQVTATGHVVLAGARATTSGSRVAVAVLTPTGQRDPTFSGDGLTVFGVGGASAAAAVAIQTDGRLVLAGTADGDIVLARLGTDGSLDPTLGGDGIVTSPLGGEARANGLVLDSASRAIVAGNAAGDGVTLAYRLR